MPKRKKKVGRTKKKKKSSLMSQFLEDLSHLLHEYLYEMGIDLPTSGGKKKKKSRKRKR
jgi:hypothetical protein